VSVLAIAWAFKVPLPAKEKLVLLALADAADDDGYCWPSQTVLAQKASMGERTVRRHVAYLRDAGLLEIEVRSSSHGRRTNVYWLHVGADLGDIFAGRSQPAKMAGCDDGVDDAPVDNSHSRRSEPTGQNGRLGSQPASSGRLAAASSGRLLPYGGLNRNYEPPDQTGPAREPVPDPPGRDGRVGSGPVRDDSASGGGAPSAPAARLVACCLPEWMQALDADGARAVGALLAERVGAGWRPAEIRQTMGDPPAGGVTRMAGLVCSRLRRNVDPVLAPARLRAEAEAVREERRRPREAPAQPVDPQFEAALAWAEREHPEASRWERVRLAERRLAAVRGGESA
jgi:biotin operon repressor